MKCPYCTTTNTLYAHDSACPLHPDKIAEADLKALVESNTGFALHVREVRALERIATALEALVDIAKAESTR